MSGDKTWLFYVLLAGLSWGTYVPIIFYGGSELGGKSGARLMAILCVGLAYFVIAVLFPLVLYTTGQEQWPELKPTGLIFASLAGVAGAVGAICVIFASKSAPGPEYRMFIAPLIFSLAPLINTLVSMFWHPQKGEPFHFTMPASVDWKLLIGIVFVAAGAFFVLWAKESSEQKPAPAIQKSDATATP